MLRPGDGAPVLVGRYFSGARGGADLCAARLATAVGGVAVDVVSMLFDPKGPLEHVDHGVCVVVHEPLLTTS